MKVVFNLQNGRKYEEDIDKMCCGGGYYLYFYVNGWYHPKIQYDIPLGRARVFSMSECIDCYREINDIRSIEVLA